ncbi:MAG: DUF2497 domain-containing protein [Hyphomicrobiaceae bacterium]
MSKAEKVGEPSMEDILASIRKIIAEEPAQPSTAAAPMPPPAPPAAPLAKSDAAERPDRKAIADTPSKFDSIDDVLGLADDSDDAAQPTAPPLRPGLTSGSAPSRSVPSWLFPRSGSDGVARAPEPTPSAARPDALAPAPAAAEAEPVTQIVREPRPATTATRTEETASPGDTGKPQDLGAFVPGSHTAQREPVAPTFDPPPMRPTFEPAARDSARLAAPRPNPLPHELPQASPPSAAAPDVSDPFAPPAARPQDAAVAPASAEKPARSPTSIFDRLAALGVNGPSARGDTQPDRLRLRDRDAPAAAPKPRDEPKPTFNDIRPAADVRDEAPNAPVATPPADAASAIITPAPASRTADEPAPIAPAVAAAPASEPKAQPAVTDAAPGLPATSEAKTVVATPRAIVPADVAIGTVPAAQPAGRTLEDTVAELLRPMLRDWLDANMPRIVEKALRVELANSIDAKPNGSKS